MATRGEPATHRLYLLRHAEALSVGSDWHDSSRELSPRGRTQARAVGEFLAGQRVELVLCSSAVRARQTAELLDLAAPIHYLDRLYNAAARQLISELSGVADDLHRVLIVGHAPGIPALAQSLADEPTSDASALERIRYNYPPATLAGLEFSGGWSELYTARLFTARLA